MSVLVEEQLPAAWSDALGRTRPEETMLTRAFSGRAGRAIATSHARAAGVANNDLERMQAWAGQSAARARAVPARQLVDELWSGARQLLD